MEMNEIKDQLQNNLMEIEEKIQKISSELQNYQEFRLKLIGGIETINLLELESKNKSEEINSDA